MRLLLIFLFILTISIQSSKAEIKSSRSERLAIKEGNDLFKEGEYVKALSDYQKALSHNPNSAYAGFNLAITQIKIAKSSKNQDKNSKQTLEAGIQRLKSIASMSGEYAHIASLANYNLGNYAFRDNKFPDAINYYKQSLRLNPNNDEARRNLRIAQLKQQDKNKDQNNKKNNEDKNKNNEDKDKRNENNEKKDNSQKNQPPKEEKINPQSADQILKAMENKENATRSKMMKQNKNQSQRRSHKNW